MEWTIICGGSNGIGKSVATEIISRGGGVLIFDKEEPDFGSDSSILFQAVDFGDSTDVQVALGSIAKLLGHYPVTGVSVVNSLRVRENRGSSESLENWDYVIRVCLSVPHLVCKVALKFAQSRNVPFRVCNLSSVLSSEVALEQPAHYGAIKAAQDYLTKYWSVANRGSTVRIVSTGVSLGLVQKEGQLTQGNFEGNSRWMELAKSVQPSGRVAQQAEVASTVVWLLLDAPASVNGAIVNMDDGARHQEVYSLIGFVSNG